MTMRRIVGLLMMLGIIGCRRDAAPALATRTTLVPSPGVSTFQFSKDGRLAYARLVDGKSAIFVSDAEGRGARRVSSGTWDAAPIWSPDGQWIAFMRDAGGQTDVFIVPSNGGAERAVAATPAPEFASGWLADGSALLFTRRGAHGLESWAYRLAEGSSARQLEGEGSVDAFASPDGRSLAYTLSKGGHRTVWLWDLEKRTGRQLTTEGYERVSSQSFSPDGRTLLYSSRRTGTGDLWLLDIASGKRRQLTQDIGEDRMGRWSPDGTRIVFTSDRGGQWDIWVIATGENDVQRITDDAVDEEDPQWTPDGRSIVASVGLGLPHLYSVPLAGGPPTPLTSGDWTVNDGEVSPDGQRVAYSGSKNGDLDIWVVPVTGGESKLVSGAQGYDGGVTWSPDGTRVAFMSVRTGNPDVWIAPIDGGAAVRLTDWGTSEADPRWSPDGKTIAFLSTRESEGRDLWTMPASGGAATRLTRSGTVDLPRWSPDGRTIAFNAQVGGAGSAVFLLPAHGGTPKQLSPVTSQRPQWRPDGREIKVMQCEKEHCAVNIWSAEGKRLRTLTTGNESYEYDLLWSSDGSRVLVGWQDVGTDGGERVDVRPSAGGSTRGLARPPGFSMTGVGFADGDRRAILIGAPNGTVLQRIEVPAPVALSKR